MKITKRHYYKYINPITGKIKEFQYERAMPIDTKRKLHLQGYKLELEIYVDPFLWKILKDRKKYE